MTEDAKSLTRTAQQLVVEARRGFGSPPNYGSAWEPLWGAKIDRIEINRDGKPSVATIWFPDSRWHDSQGLIFGDNIRIRTNEPSAGSRTIVFAGFFTSRLSEFSGGSQRSKAYERNALVCQDYRWLLAITSPLYGQLARGPDDYTNFGQDNQTPINDSSTFLSGRRTIFNADGSPNRDPVLLVTPLSNIPVFADSDIAVYWTARDMLRYILSPSFNQAYQYLPISDPNKLAGLDHDDNKADWDKVLNHIVVEGLNVIEAVQLLCTQLGWGFRQDCDNDGTVNFVFYKIATAKKYIRDTKDTTILHKLYAPAANEDISSAVAAGEKLLWSMTLAEDIAAVVNNPWGLGAPHRFEFTAELVPAWLDSDLEPDTANNNTDLFFTEADLQDMAAPNNKTYYKNYHPRGDSFRRNVGRKWVLNESGRYSNSKTYDRGVPFDFSTIIPKEYIKDNIPGSEKRLYGPFKRQLLPALTVDKDSLNSVGIKVEFCFNGDEEKEENKIWQVIPAAIGSLKDECGIYIAEANLAEMVDQAEGTISGGDLDGIQLNYFTSLCDDKLNSRIFKDGDWKTRVRVTASVQLDQRLRRQAAPTSATGSPFNHRQIYDFSAKYALQKRTESSIFASSELPVWEIDSTDYFDKHLAAARAANEDMSVSAQFTLERLWLGDGSGEPDFAIGDCIEKITGRDYDLSAALGDTKVYPEIIQIIYSPEKQMTKLITRDLRFAEVVL